MSTTTDSVREVGSSGISSVGSSPNSGYDLVAHLQRQIAFSERAFGPGTRTHGLIDHITKELREIAEQPFDLMEWVDVTLLALDGAWRSGNSAEEITAALGKKLAKNEAREWPDWRTSDPDKAIEHVRPAASQPKPVAPTAKEGYRDAAEAMGLSFLTRMADGSTICTSCQRGSIDGVIPHAESCRPGNLLRLIELEKKMEAMQAVTARERAEAVRKLRRSAGVQPLRQITCSRAVLVLDGGPECKGVLHCDLALGHGDGWHEAQGIKWPEDATRIAHAGAGRIRIDRFYPAEPLYVTLPAAAEESQS